MEKSLGKNLLDLKEGKNYLIIFETFVVKSLAKRMCGKKKIYKEKQWCIISVLTCVPSHLHNLIDCNSLPLPCIPLYLYLIYNKKHIIDSFGNVVLLHIMVWLALRIFHHHYISISLIITTIYIYIPVILAIQRNKKKPNTKNKQKTVKTIILFFFFSHEKVFHDNDFFNETLSKDYTHQNTKHHHISIRRERQIRL